jgi:2-keto-4-pentenoate hydratase
MTNHRLHAIAERLAVARQEGARMTLDNVPRDFEEGFAVQDLVVARLGQPVIGWKVIEIAVGGPVIFAPLLADGVVPAGGAWHVAGPEPAGFELEIAFRMGRDVPKGAEPGETLDAVGTAHVVFELCQSRNASPDPVPRHVSLADCIQNAGIVVGDAIPDWRRKDLKSVPGRLLVDGEVHSEGKSIDPLRALKVLAPALSARGKALKAGQIVITGSLSGMNWLTGSHRVRGEIDGCGAVEALVTRRQGA